MALITPSVVPINRPSTDKVFSSVGVTTVDSNLGTGGATTQPPVITTVHEVVLDGTGILYPEDLDDNEYGNGIYTDGIVDLYCVDDFEGPGLPSCKKYATTSVVSANVNGWVLFTGADKAINPSTLSAVYGVSSGQKLHAPIYFAICAIDGSGNPCTLSSFVSVTPTTEESGSSVRDQITILHTAVQGTLPAPANVTASLSNGQVAVSWDAVPGAAGYLGYRSFTHPSLHAEPTHINPQKFMTLADSVDVRRGDVAVIRKRVLYPEESMISNRLHNLPSYANKFVPRAARVTNLPAGEFYNLSTDHSIQCIKYVQGEKPLQELGDHYSRITLLEGVSNPYGDVYWHGGDGQQYYPVLKPGKVYEYEYVLRASQPVDVILSFDAPGVSDITVSIGTEWKTVVGEFSPTASMTGVGAGNAGISFTAPVGGVSLDIARRRSPYIKSSGFMGFTDERSSQVCIGSPIRSHELIKNKPLGYFLDDVLVEKGESPKDASLKYLFDLCKDKNSFPHIQLEWWISDEEATRFVGFMASNTLSGDAGALLREASGDITPYTDIFPKIRLEFGNEATFNTAGAFYFMPRFRNRTDGTYYSRGESFGFMLRRLWDAMALHQDWSKLLECVKDDYYVGGHIGTDEGNKAWERSLHGNLVGVSVYLRGDFANAQSPATDDLVTAQSILDSYEGIVKQNIQDRAADLSSRAGAAYGSTVFLDVYETNHGYPQSSVTTDQQQIDGELMGKSRLAATAFLNMLCGMFADGVKNASFFALKEGDLWTTHKDQRTWFNWQLTRYLAKYLVEFTSERLTLNNPLTGQFATGSGFVLVERRRAYLLRSVTHPGRCIVALLNLSADEEVYGLTDNNRVVIEANTHILSAVSARSLVFNRNMRERNRYPDGLKLETNGSYSVDPLSVNEDLADISVPVPVNLGTIYSDDSLGLPVDGLNGGCCVLLKLDGAVYG